MTTEPALVFDDVLRAAGPRSGRCDRLGGLPVASTLVPAAAVVGTLGRPGLFDRRFRPLNARATARRDRIAELMAAGVALPPVRLLRIGALASSSTGTTGWQRPRPRDGGRSPRRSSRSARGVGRVRAAPAGPGRTEAEREFLRAVPLPDLATTQIHLADPGGYAELAARAFRWCGSGAITPEAAAAWWHEEVLAGQPAPGRGVPVAALLLSDEGHHFR